jgi:type IV pilus assembly protein PilM
MKTSKRSFGIGKAKTSLGLDIGSHYLKLVELTEQADSVIVSKCQVEELPHEAIVDKQIMDRELVIEKLRDLVKDSRIKNREVMISVAGRGVIIKKIITDRMNEAELEDAIEWEAKQHIPYDISDVTLDHQTICTEMETDHTDVLLVAAKNDLVYSGSDLIRLSGLIPQGIGLDAFAVQNALYQNNYIPNQGTIAVLHLGFNSTNATIITNGVFEANRDLPVAGKLFLENIVRRLGLSVKEGFDLLWNGAHDGPIRDALDEVIRSTSEKLVEVLERAFPQYWSTDTQSPVAKVILCGGGAIFPGLKDFLKEHLALPVEIADPLKELSTNGNLPDDLSEKLSPSLTLAVGLALEGLGKPENGIRFNLLPAEERASGGFRILEHRQVAIPAVIGVLFLAGATYQTIHQNDHVSRLNEQIALLNKESEIFKEKIGLVEEFTQKRNDIIARVKTIEDLDRDRFLRVRFLDEINRLLPNMTWLESIREASATPGVAIIEGVTTNNLKVSEFMSNLMMSDLFETVDLAVSQQSEIADQDITRFTIQVKIKGTFIQQPVNTETKASPKTPRPDNKKK